MERKHFYVSVESTIFYGLAALLQPLENAFDAGRSQPDGFRDEMLGKPEKMAALSTSYGER
jgi:hypothetical protein